MPEHCEHCGAEINGGTEMCPGCGANIRAERAEAKVEMLEGAINGWRRQNEKLAEHRDACASELKERSEVLDRLMREDRLLFRLLELIGDSHNINGPYFDTLDLKLGETTVAWLRENMRIKAAARGMAVSGITEDIAKAAQEDVVKEMDKQVAADIERAATVDSGEDGE